MRNLTKRGLLAVMSLALVTLGYMPNALADDKDDVLAFIKQYGDLEGNLEAQSEMIRDDRVHIVAGQRRSDQAVNFRLQKANRDANEALNGGKTEIITTIESPQVAIYGNVAVASYVQVYNNFPHNKPPAPGQPVWVTLVLVKEGGEWGIAHAHASPTSGN